MGAILLRELKENNPEFVDFWHRVCVEWEMKIIIKFQDWLIDQQNRKDRIGDLARAPGMQAIELKTSKRNADEHKTWVNIVIGIPETEYIAIFNEAWQEFSVAKQAASK